MRARSVEAGRLEQPQPVARRRGEEHAAGTVDHRWDPRGAQLVPDQIGVLVGADEHRDVPRLDRIARGRVSIGHPVLDRGTRGEQRDDVRGEVAGDVRSSRRRSGEPVSGLVDRRLVAVHDPHAERRGARSAAQPGRPVRGIGLDPAIDDALVTEPRVSEQRVQGVEQGLVAAAVDL